MPDELVFIVDLHRVSSTVLRWTQGTLKLTGSFENGDEFVVGNSLRVDMRAEDEDDSLPACVIDRYDQRNGTFSKDDAGEYTGFEGVLVHQFAATAQSDCSDLLQGENAIASALPCTIQYEITAERDD